MKNRVKLYKFTKYILHTIAAQIRLSFNHLIKEPWEKSRNFRYGSPEDYLSKGHETVGGGGGGFHLPPVLIGLRNGLLKYD